MISGSNFLMGAIAGGTSTSAIAFVFYTSSDVPMVRTAHEPAAFTKNSLEPSPPQPPEASRKAATQVATVEPPLELSPPETVTTQVPYESPSIGGWYDLVDDGAIGKAGGYAFEWAKHDPVSAMNAVDAVGKAYWSAPLKHVVIGRWARQNPAAAIDWVAENEAYDLVGPVLQISAEANLYDTIQALAGFPEKEQANIHSELMHVIGDWPIDAENYGLVQGWLDDTRGVDFHPLPDYRERQVAMEELLAWAFTLPPGEREVVAESLPSVSRNACP